MTNVDVEDLKYTPSTSMADALAGVVPGIQAMQSNGRLVQYLSFGCVVFLHLVLVVLLWF